MECEGGAGGDAEELEPVDPQALRLELQVLCDQAAQPVSISGHVAFGQSSSYAVIRQLGSKARWQ